jgi:hypothetical protein
MDDLFTNTAILWFLGGLLLLIAEMSSITIVFLFFGFGAWAAGLVAFIWPARLDLQIITFIFVSITLLVFLRKFFKRIFDGWRSKPVSTSNREDEEIIGRMAIVHKDFLGHKGLVEFRGTTWNAESVESGLIEGEELIIEAREDLTLKVRKK